MNGVQVFLGGIQFRDECFGIARKRFECVQRLVDVRVNGAARRNQLLAHLVDARDAVRHGLDAALHAAHGVQHVGEALVKVVVRAFKLVADAAEIRDGVQLRHGRRRHEHVNAHGFKAVRANAYRVGVLLAGQAEKHREFVRAHGLDLRARRLKRFGFVHVDACADEKGHVVAVVFVGVWVWNGVDVYFHQAAGAGKIPGCGRDAVQLVGHVEGPRHLQGSRIVRDAFVVKARTVHMFQGEIHAVVPHLGFVVGSHVINRRIIPIVGQAGHAVEVHALDDAHIGQQAVFVQIDIDRFVGSGGGRGGARDQPKLRRKQRHGERRSRQAEKFISFHRFAPRFLPDFEYFPYSWSPCACRAFAGGP